MFSVVGTLHRQSKSGKISKIYYSSKPGILAPRLISLRVVEIDKGHLYGYVDDCHPLKALRLDGVSSVRCGLFWVNCSEIEWRRLAELYHRENGWLDVVSAYRGSAQEEGFEPWVVQFGLRNTDSEARCAGLLVERGQTKSLLTR